MYISNVPCVLLRFPVCSLFHLKFYCTETGNLLRVRALQWEEFVDELDFPEFFPVDVIVHSSVILGTQKADRERTLDMTTLLLRKASPRQPTRGRQCALRF